jgi:ribose transport system ATP-binding protein
MDTDLVLVMQGIRKSFPGVTALDAVDFQLRRGEVHVLLGENGAGKSTLMKILSGAYRKDAGRILLEGREVEIKHPRHAQELGISTIYQEFNLVGSLSVADNIFLGRELCRIPGVISEGALRDRAVGVLSSLGVDIDPRRPVRSLGIAEQQMVEIAKAISLESKILIMDEPTSALTEREINELFARIRALKQSGVSIIYISHRLEEIFSIGDRVTVLRDGKQVGTRLTGEATMPALIKMMVDRELTQQFPKAYAPRGEEILRVEGLNRAGVLRNVSFSLYRGEVLGIAGLLGSGRTELARAIFGADPVDSGRVFIRGRLQQARSPRNAINNGLGFLTEDRKAEGLVLALSVKQNVCLPSLERLSRLGFVNRNEEAQLAARYVGDLRIKTTGLDQRVAFLSGGNQQKVVLSKWLACNADVLIFDEPTRGIDVGAKAEIYQLMNQLAASGVGIIMISSELPEVLGMSDRILVMHKGAIKGEFLAGEPTQEDLLHAALGGE